MRVPFQLDHYNKPGQLLANAVKINAKTVN